MAKLSENGVYHMIREKRKQAIKSLYWGIGLLAIAFVAFMFKPLMWMAGAAGVLFFLYYLYLSFRYWKCPACGEQFPVVYSRMDQRTECWYCLESILDEEMVAQNKDV